MIDDFDVQIERYWDKNEKKEKIHGSSPCLERRGVKRVLLLIAIRKRYCSIMFTGPTGE